MSDILALIIGLALVPVALIGIACLQGEGKSVEEMFSYIISWWKDKLS